MGFSVLCLAWDGVSAIVEMSLQFKDLYSCYWFLLFFFFKWNFCFLFLEFMSFDLREWSKGLLFAYSYGYVFVFFYSLVFASWEEENKTVFLSLRYLWVHFLFLLTMNKKLNDKIWTKIEKIIMMMIMIAVMIAIIYSVGIDKNIWHIK